MSNKKLKKKIKLFILLLIFALVMLLIMLVITFSYSKKRILGRLISGLENLNYSYKNNEGSEVQVFGMYEKITNKSSGEVIYNDYKDNETRIIYPDVAYMDENDNNGIIDMQYYKMYIEKYFNNNKYIYKYCGKEKIGGRKCLKIKFIFKSTEADEIDIWIDDLTNVIKKFEHYQYINNEKIKVKDLDSYYYDFISGSNKIDDIKITEEILSTHSSETNG